jgi:hypothetical protein
VGLGQGGVFVGLGKLGLGQGGVLQVVSQVKPRSPKRGGPCLLFPFFLSDHERHEAGDKSAARGHAVDSKRGRVCSY